MEIRHLLTFKTVVEKGGFKKAAEYLGYAQSSITTHIKDLENEVGAPLFDRIGKKVILTHYGQQFLPYAIKIIELHTQALNMDEEPIGNLKIGISELLTVQRIPSILLEYKKLYPKVTISLKSLDHCDISSSLQNGDIDLALILEKEDWPLPELHCEKLKREEMVLISSLENKEDFKTILYTEESCCYKSLFENYLESKHIEVEQILKFQSIEAIKQCVIGGLGCSLVPYFSVREEIEGNKIKGERVSHELHANMSTYLVYHKDKWISPAMRSMITLIRDHVKTWG
ncbi:LysR family transcriptional regulator [Paenibacillus chitinolyticus]|uniref:LysR family transcriptional regulator n=1 Tax=Paenibacillus chitinolyticus TaxID=79263 RepID=UPI0026E4E95D|nr:LysR family transcriptional regulator [Paenibacillus chitinolyticus]GKS13164.1 LysR family transcriptional regulator [Paenibacillus chitinolyticus]